MQLKIKLITFSNIMSFGSNPTTINFDRGLTLWSGINGSGKSSALLDTLSFCLYGKPYRKIKIEEIINRKNKEGLKTKCEFANGSDNYILTRNKSPDKLDLIKNGSSIDLLSSKKLTQVELDKILGVSYEIFKQVISIAVSYNKPFLILDSKDKRKSIEQMFGLTEFAKMNKVLQEKNKTAKRNYDLLENNRTNIESTIRILKKQIIDLEEQNKNFERLNREKIEKYTTQLESEKLLLDSSIKEAEPYQTILEKLKEEINKHNKPIYTDAKNKIEKEKSEHEWNIKSLTSQIKKLTSETICPTCKKPFDEVERKAEIAQKTITKEQSEKSLKGLEEKLEILKHNIDVIEKKESKLSNQIIDLKEIERDIKEHHNTIRNLESQITDVKNSKNTIDIDKVIAEVAQKENELQININKKDIESTNIKNYSVADKILCDEGARSYIIEKMIPVLNRKVNEYLGIFEIPVKISFNKFMDEKIISLEHFKQEVSYWSFSEGEKKRLDFAIMIALVDTMKIVSNWTSNLFIIDELLDNAVDVNGLEKMITTLKEITITKDLGIYIISHRMTENFGHMFDRKMIVKKNQNNFSVIEKEE